MPVGIRRSLSLGLVSLCALVGGLAFWATPALAAEHYGALAAFGSPGAGAGQLKDPAGIAVNDASTGLDAGDVYVVDKGNNRVERFTATGKYEGQFNASDTYEDLEELMSVKTGEPKPATGQFSAPEGIAVDNSGKSVLEDPSVGDVYVVDEGAQRR